MLISGGALATTSLLELEPDRLLRLLPTSPPSLFPWRLLSRWRCVGVGDQYLLRLRAVALVVGGEGEGILNDAELKLSPLPRDVDDEVLKV